MNQQRIFLTWILGGPVLAGIAWTALASDVVAPREGGQIWQCVTNGVRTFSNNPCGEKSTPVNVGPINTMSPPPVIRNRDGNGTDRGDPGYADPTGLSDQVNSDHSGEDNSYSAVEGFAFVPLTRAAHRHRAKQLRGSRAERPSSRRN